jgi:hypothetical protein
MKPILMTLVLFGAASIGLAAPPPDPADDRETAPAADRAADPSAPASAVPPSLSKHLDDVEVISADPAARNITLKIKGEEETLPVPVRLHPTLRVVKPGDKVRIYYREEEADGAPRRVESLVITEPNHAADRPAPKEPAKAPAAEAPETESSDRR